MITLQELSSDSKASKAIAEKAAESSFGIEDVHDEVARITAHMPQKPDEVYKFLESRKTLIQSQAHLASAEKQTAIARIEGIMKGKKGTLPTPGGVGYGVIYDQSLRSSFGTGTVLTVNYICPDKPGGNVSNTVYLTATNRSRRGVEALMHYNAQNLVEFRVYDWCARPGVAGHPRPHGSRRLFLSRHNRREDVSERHRQQLHVSSPIRWHVAQ